MPRAGVVLALVLRFLAIENCLHRCSLELQLVLGVDVKAETC